MPDPGYQVAICRTCPTCHSRCARLAKSLGTAVALRWRIGMNRMVDLTDDGSDKAQCVDTNGDSIEPSQHIVSLFSSIVRSMVSWLARHAFAKMCESIHVLRSGVQASG